MLLGSLDAPGSDAVHCRGKPCFNLLERPQVTKSFVYFQPPTKSVKLEEETVV